MSYVFPETLLTAIFLNAALYIPVVLVYNTAFKSEGLSLPVRKTISAILHWVNNPLLNPEPPTILKKTVEVDCGIVTVANLYHPEVAP